MSKWIKNNTLSNKTWLGQVVLAGDYYNIEATEESAWGNDSTVLADIGSGDAIIAKDDSGSNDITDVATAINYLRDIIFEIDSDGRQIQRSAATYKGWRYLAHPIEVETSNLTGVFSEDWQGNTRTDYTIKFYDSSDNELTTQATIDTDCVKTVLTIKPDYDYDIIGGNLHQKTQPISDVRLWVVAGAVELGAAGVKEFVGGLNFSYMGADEQIQTDGRASARMNKTTTGVPFNTNQMQYIFKHDAGYKHKVMVVVEYFRA